MEEKEIKKGVVTDRFHRAATGRLDDDLTGGDWQELSWLVDDACPALRQLAEKATPPLRVEEWRLCMLVWLGFKPMELCMLLDLSPSHVSMLRVRLGEKVFGCKVPAQEFDERIRALR